MYRELSALSFKQRLHQLGWMKYVIVVGFLGAIFVSYQLIRLLDYHNCVGSTAAMQWLKLEGEWSQKNNVNDIPTSVMHELGKVAMDSARQSCKPMLYDYFSGTGMNRVFAFLNPIGVANAQAGFDPKSATLRLKFELVTGAFVCVVGYFLLCIFSIFFSRNERVISFAFESVKMLGGFFTGLVAAFVGSSSLIS